MQSRGSNGGVFREAILPDGHSRAGSFGAGVGIEIVLLTLLLVIPMLLPKKFVIAAKQQITSIAAPVLTEWKPQPPPKPVVKKVVLKELPKPIEQPVVEVPKPKIYNPVIKQMIVPKTEEKRVQAPVVEVAKIIPSLGSSAIPDLKKPREEVQTGGFGDPNSVPDNHNLQRAPNMTQAGGFDMPSGAGVGNGTGGDKGAKGVVASTGFGAGVAAGTTGGPRGSVQTGGFGDEKAAAPQQKQVSSPVSRSKPMELLNNPKPQYSTEGRSKKVEGDVVLQVLFTASGEIKVIRVVQSLGYGLDEEAEAAARLIRFNPATVDGQPIDVTANVREKFQLAN
jgi:TonB family protein